jgi:hypothetical protein
MMNNLPPFQEHFSNPQTAGFDGPRIERWRDRPGFVRGLAIVD